MCFWGKKKRVPPCTDSLLSFLCSKPCVSCLWVQPFKSVSKSAVLKAYFVVKWEANRCSQVLVTYVLTLRTITLRFEPVSAFGFKIRLCQETACKTALGKGRAEQVGERQESRGGSGKGGAGISPSVTKCLAGGAMPDWWQWV